MRLQIPPILLSPLKDVPAQPIGIDSGDILEVLVLIILNAIGPVIVSSLTGFLVSKQTDNTKSIYISTVTGACIGILIALIWWMLVLEGDHLDNFPWPGYLYPIAIWVWPNPVGMLVTAFIARKVIFRILKIRSEFRC